MSTRFDAQRPLILIRARISGPAKDIIVELALDTGAAHTTVSPGLLRLIGYIASLDEAPVEVVTASGVASCPTVVVGRFEALGKAENRFPVICLDLPARAQLDGLLGLDFLRRNRLVIDFQGGEVMLE